MLNSLIYVHKAAVVNKYSYIIFDFILYFFFIFLHYSGIIACFKSHIQNYYKNSIIYSVFVVLYQNSENVVSMETFYEVSYYAILVECFGGVKEYFILAIE